MTPIVQQGPAESKGVPEAVPPGHVVLCEDVEGLAAIAKPALNLAIWRRELPRDADALWLGLVARRAGLHADWVAPDEATLRRDLGGICSAPECSEALAWWAADIALLSRCFTDLTGVVRPRVRLERVEDGGCILFHEDYMALRILCTYAGPGMQWVANSDVDRSQLGLQGRRPAQANAAIVRDAACIRSIPTGHVAAFKGALYPGNDAGALIHRSAPVLGPAQFRIRLCIDDTAGCAC